MLTSKDLMIGYWYAFRGHPYKCTASDIASIAECEEKGAPTDISEIPITAEILENNGFIQCEPQGYDLYVKDKDGRGLYNILWQSEPYNYLEIAAYTYAFGEFSKSNIKYVHQLQNALQLCGIEHEITL